MPRYESITLSPHCRERLRDRDISKQQILRVIASPEIEMPTKRSRRRKISRAIDGTPPVVVIKEVSNGKKAIIVTAYWRD